MPSLIVIPLSSSRPNAWRVFVVGLSLCLLTSLGFAADAVRSPKKVTPLLVHGPGFVVSVDPQAGWRTDTTKASRFGANVIFYPASQPANKVDTLIRVLVAAKTEENTREDFVQEMAQYKTKFPTIAAKSLPAAHPEYRAVAKQFSVAGKFSEYVTYVKPGEGKKFMFAVTMNKQKKDASARELEAYRKIIASLQLL